MEKNESGITENKLKAEEFREWLDKEEPDTIERVDFLHRIYEVRIDLEQLNIE